MKSIPAKIGLLVASCGILPPRPLRDFWPPTRSRTSSSSWPTTSATSASPPTAASRTRRRTSTGSPPTGVRFEHCHVQPLCTPTRVQLMTGQYNVRNYLNFGTLVRHRDDVRPPAEEGRVRHRHLRQVAARPREGLAAALRVRRVVPVAAHPAARRGTPTPAWSTTARNWTSPNGEYGPNLVNDFALDFVTRHKDRPFFLYYPMMLTHNPFQPTPDSPDWDPKAMGEAVNQDVEALRRHGRVHGQADRPSSTRSSTSWASATTRWCCSSATTAPAAASRAGSRGRTITGGKGTTTAAGTHVPLIASWPGVIKHGQVNRDLISSVDFLPTICQAAGADVPANIDGVSFLPQLRGEKGTPREWLYSWYSPRQQADMTVSEYAFDHGYKLYRTGQFFDLAADPFRKTGTGPGLHAGRDQCRRRSLAGRAGPVHSAPRRNSTARSRIP